MIDDIEKRFTYHPPVTATQVVKYERLRSMAKEFAYQIEFDCPDSRERSLALTKLEEAVMWSNAAISRHE